MASLQVPFADFSRDLIRLRAIVSSITPLQYEHKYLISELVCLRLFDCWELVVAETAYRLACNASYFDGAVPVRLITAKSIQDARAKMLRHNRKKPKSNLDWSKASYIAEAVEHVLDPSDHFTTYVLANGIELNRLRLVRNVIAHQNKKAKTDYSNQILRPLYGSDRFLRVGKFLLTDRFGANRPLEKFMDVSEIFVRGLLK